MRAPVYGYASTDLDHTQLSFFRANVLRLPAGCDQAQAQLPT
jgi:hypothetical protein